MQEVIYGIEWKALVTIPAAFLANYICGDWSILVIWFLFVFLDLVAGWYRALIFQQVDRGQLYAWVKKLLTHMGCLAGLNAVLWSFSITTGQPNTLLNWFVLLFTCCEAISVVNNFAEAGIKFPPTVLWFLHKVRLKSMRTLAGCIDPEHPDISDLPEELASPDLARTRYSNTAAISGMPNLGRITPPEDRRCPPGADGTCVPSPGPKRRRSDNIQHDSHDINDQGLAGGAGSGHAVLAGDDQPGPGG